MHWLRNVYVRIVGSARRYGFKTYKFEVVEHQSWGDKGTVRHVWVAGKEQEGV